MTKVCRGKTEDADAAMLGAPFWQVGQKLIGVVLWPFKTEVGDCYTLRLGKPVKVGDREQQVVSVGNLTGFRMALEAVGGAPPGASPSRTPPPDSLGFPTWPVENITTPQTCEAAPAEAGIVPVDEAAAAPA